jgi:hypothetical protein
MCFQRYSLGRLWLSLFQIFVLHCCRRLKDDITALGLLCSSTTPWKRRKLDRFHQATHDSGNRILTGCRISWRSDTATRYVNMKYECWRLYIWLTFETNSKLAAHQYGMKAWQEIWLSSAVHYELKNIIWMKIGRKPSIDRRCRKGADFSP